MLHAYLLVDGARTAQFYLRQNSEFCQLKRWFYQLVRSIKHHENPESYCSVTASGIVKVYGETGKSYLLLLFVPKIRPLRPESHIKRILK